MAVRSSSSITAATMNESTACASCLPRVNNPPTTGNVSQVR